MKLANDFNYSVVESGNVTFRFNKWELTNEAKAALDLMIQKATAMPRPLIEVLGYTDDIGPSSYNLTLSRRRAEAVARYLVQNNVPLKSISLLGLGKEQTPAAAGRRSGSLQSQRQQTGAARTGSARPHPALRSRRRLLTAAGASASADAAQPQK